MSEDKRESPIEQKLREERQIRDTATQLKEQNRANEQTWNNSGLLRDIQSRQCEVLEKLGAFEVTIANIDNHTSVMNEELGSCQKSLESHDKRLENLEKNIFKLGWKELGIIIGGVSTITGIIATLIQIFVR